MISCRVADPVFMAMADTENVHAALVEGIDDDVRAERKSTDRPVQPVPLRSGLRKFSQLLDRQPQGRGIGVSLPHAKILNTVSIDCPDIGARRFGEPKVGHSGGASAGDGLGPRFGEDFIHGQIADA